MHAERSLRLQAIPEHGTIAVGIQDKKGLFAVTIAARHLAEPADRVASYKALQRAIRSEHHADHRELNQPYHNDWPELQPAKIPWMYEEQIGPWWYDVLHPYLARTLLLPGMDWEKEGPEPSVAGFTVSSYLYSLYRLDLRHPWR